MNVYTMHRANLISHLNDSLGFFKLAIQWTGAMVAEFVDKIIQEYPNWKPADFMLFIEMAKTGKFKSEYTHALDFPTFFSWANDYNSLWLDELFAIRQKEMKAIDEPVDEEASREEGIRVLQEFLDKMEAQRKAKEAKFISPPESEVDAHIREAVTKWRMAMNDHLMEFGSSDYSSYAERELWEKENPQKEWVSNYIFSKFGYRMELR